MKKKIEIQTTAQRIAEIEQKLSALQTRMQIERERIAKIHAQIRELSQRVDLFKRNNYL